ncbi:hypothetical protein [Mycolicibacterium sp.]
MASYIITITVSEAESEDEAIAIAAERLRRGDGFDIESLSG